MRSPAILARLACLAGVILTAPAAAQEASSERAAAEALFERAMERMGAGDFAKACPALEEVVRLQPRGIGALEALSECHEKAGRLASAWARARQAADLAARTNDSRLAQLTSRAEALSPRAGRLVIEVAPALRQVAGLQISRDGVAVPPALWAQAVVVDAGEVEITVEATGHQPLVTSSTVVDGRVARLLVEDLGPALPAAPVPAAAGWADANPHTTAATPPPPLEGARPAWPWVVGGVGAASALTAIPFLAWWADANSRFAIACPTVNASGAPECVSELEVANAIDAERTRAAALAITFGVVGVAGLGIGVVGLASASGPQAEVAVGPGEISLRGIW